MALAVAIRVTLRILRAPDNAVLPLSVFWKAFTIAEKTETKAFAVGSNLLPICILNSLISFIKSFVCDLNVSNRFSASSVKAIFVSNAVSAVTNVLTSRSPASPTASKARIVLCCLRPKSSNIATALPPSDDIFANEVTNIFKTCAGSSLANSWNACTDKPVTSTKVASCLPPVLAAICICWNTRAIAVPPACDWTPTACNAVAIPKTSDTVAPATLAPAANRNAVDNISSSKAAKLLPKSTNEDAKLSISPSGNWNISDNLARPNAALSVDNLVATPNFAIVSIKFSRPSIDIPNCPPSSPIWFNAEVVTGISCARFLTEVAKFLKSVSEPSTVFLIPANDSSNLEAAPTVRNIAPLIAAIAPTAAPAAAIIDICVFTDAAVNFLRDFSDFFAAWSWTLVCVSS